LQRNAAFQIPLDKSDDIMNHLHYAKHDPSHMSFSKWLFPGLLLISSIMLLRYSDYLNWLNQSFGKQLEAPLNLVLGIFTTIYVVIFMGAHSGELGKFLLNFKKKSE
jgi:hypothetical protein